MTSQKLAPDLGTVFSYNCSCTGEIVYAYPGNTYGDVTLCSVYFNEEYLPPAGQHRSQWEYNSPFILSHFRNSDKILSTLIHEAMHFRDTLGATDRGTGVEVCKALAIQDPEKAVSNAE